MAFRNSLGKSPPGRRPENVFAGNAEVAQLVEQLIRNQQVTGSSPVFGSTSASRCPGRQNYFAAAWNNPCQRKPICEKGFEVDVLTVETQPRSLL